MEFISQLEKYIEENSLFSKTDKLLITVSGGIDSVVLAHSLAGLKYSFAIAHCNFQLRGEESEKDETLVRKLAHGLGASFFFEKFPTAKIQDDIGGSIQMVARDLRYTWFEKIRSDYQYDYILTAHHQNDLLETVLLNLVRGTGLSGLHGIQPKNGKIIRPLLFANKKQIEDFAGQNKLNWGEDSSNQSNKYRRNFIRNKVVPLLKEINPSLEQTILHTAEQVSLSQKFFENQLELILPEFYKEEGGFIKIDINYLRQNIDGLYLLQAILKRFNFSFSDCKNIFQSAESISGKFFYSSTHRLIRDRRFWIIDILIADNYIHFSITFEMGQIQISNTSLLKFERKEGKLEDLKNLQSNNTLILDFDQIEFPFIIRNWKPGDQFSPLGLKGSKKVSDYLIDLKINMFEKEKTLLIETKGQIAAILPNRPSNQFSVTANTTKLYIINSLLT